MIDFFDLYDLDDVDGDTGYTALERIRMQRNRNKSSASASLPKYGSFQFCPNDKHMWFTEKELIARTCNRCGANSFSQDIPPSHRLSKSIRHIDSGYCEPWDYGD